jgi:hypothetical protein
MRVPHRPRAWPVAPPGTPHRVKVWYHVIAALVGFAVAALIVYLVFGSASEQGAVQDGDAGSLAAGTSMCGSIDVADTTSAETRATAAESPPALFDAKGPIAAISDKFPKQRDWVARVHAASGLCLDELTIENSTPATGPATNVVRISMSTTEDVDDAEASAYAGGVLAQAFTPPFSPRSVTLQASVGDEQRTVVVSSRAWRAFEARRRQLKRPATIANLRLFQQASAFGAADLKLTGW